MTYNQLYNKVKKEKGLNGVQTIKLFSSILGRSEQTIKSWRCPSRECPEMALRVLKSHFSD